MIVLIAQAEELALDVPDYAQTEHLHYVLDRSVDDGASGTEFGENLMHVLDQYGPFDGIMAFSFAAMLVASLLIWNKQNLGTYPVRCAVFFCGGKVIDPDDFTRFMNSDEDGELIEIPTAHIWGAHDEHSAPEGTGLRGLCAQAVRSEFEFDGGHEIPGVRDTNAAIKAVLAIKRAIILAEDEID